MRCCRSRLSRDRPERFLRIPVRGVVRHGTHRTPGNPAGAFRCPRSHRHAGHPEGHIPARLQQLLTEATGAGINMVFIHRDSDGPDREGREREIRRGVEESGFPHPFIPVIPVQETEAWLLLDEQAIRDVVASKRETSPEVAETECHRRHQETQGNPAESTSHGERDKRTTVEEGEEQFQPSPQGVAATPRSLRRRAGPTLLAAPGARHPAGAGTARKSELKGTTRAQ